MKVMLDFETWGTSPGSALRSIGAVEFELSGKMGREFYANFSDAGQSHLRRDPDTVAWWAKQSAEAQSAFVKPEPQPFTPIALSFAKWFPTGATVWAQGANFDPMIWESACKPLGIAAPWKFYDVRDTRTVYDLAGFDPRKIKRQGVFHNALDDCKHQVRCVAAAWSMLQTGGLV